MRHATATLKGLPLNFAVVTALGFTLPAKRVKRSYGWERVAAPELLGSMLRMNPQGYVQDLRMAQFEHAPSLCWDLMKREGIWLRGPHDATKPDGTTVLRIDYWYAHKNHQHVQSGPDPEHALLRCFVASKLGESVFVPDQMVDPT